MTGCVLAAWGSVVFHAHIPTILKKSLSQPWMMWLIVTGWVLAAWAQYSQKPGLFSPNEPQQQQQQQGGVDGKQVDDLGLDLSKQGKRWFPFSDGPRNCVGQALAKMNMATTFAQLYSQYSFQLAEEVSMPTMLDLAACTSALFKHPHTCRYICCFVCSWLCIVLVTVDSSCTSALMRYLYTCWPLLALYLVGCA